MVDGNIRKSHDAKNLEELSNSIKKHGVLQPIVIQPQPDGRYVLLIGERRLIAAKQAGLNEIPALLQDRELKQNEILETRLIENLQREEIDPLDEAEAYGQLVEMGYSVSRVARRVGKSRYYVFKRLRLLKLHPKLREYVRRRTLSLSHCQALLRLEPDQQLSLANEIIERGLNEKQSRERVREILGRKLRWKLVPIRLSIEEFRTLESIAPQGNVKRLIQEVIDDLLKKAILSKSLRIYEDREGRHRGLKSLAGIK